MSAIWDREGERHVQIDIECALSFLSEFLGDYLQTTHGKLGKSDIEDVADALVVAYLDPNAHTVSDLRQTIDGFLKGAKE